MHCRGLQKFKTAEGKVENSVCNSQYYYSILYWNNAE
jgi:hypothetical protein